VSHPCRRSSWFCFPTDIFRPPSTQRQTISDVQLYGHSVCPIYIGGLRGFVFRRVDFGLYRPKGGHYPMYTGIQHVQLYAHAVSHPYRRSWWFFFPTDLFRPPSTQRGTISDLYLYAHSMCPILLGGLRGFVFRRIDFGGVNPAISRCTPVYDMYTCILTQCVPIRLGGLRGFVFRRIDFGLN